MNSISNFHIVWLNRSQRRLLHPSSSLRSQIFRHCSNNAIVVLRQKRAEINTIYSRWCRCGNWTTLSSRRLPIYPRSWFSIRLVRLVVLGVLISGEGHRRFLSRFRRSETMGTGAVFFHRFYMCHSFKQYPRYVSLNVNFANPLSFARWSRPWRPAVYFSLEKSKRRRRKSVILWKRRDRFSKVLANVIFRR